MNALGHQLTHAIVMSLLKDVTILPGPLEIGGPYAATVRVAKNTQPAPRHAYSLTCRGVTPLDATWSLYYALYEWCRDPLSDGLVADVHRADARVHEPEATQPAKSNGKGARP